MHVEAIAPSLGFGVSGPFSCAEVHKCVWGEAVSRSTRASLGLLRPPHLLLAFSLLDRALHSYPIDCWPSFS